MPIWRSAGFHVETLKPLITLLSLLQHESDSAKKGGSTTRGGFSITGTSWNYLWRSTTNNMGELRSRICWFFWHSEWVFFFEWLWINLNHICLKTFPSTAGQARLQHYLYQMQSWEITCLVASIHLSVWSSGDALVGCKGHTLGTGGVRTDSWGAKLTCVVQLSNMRTCSGHSLYRHAQVAVGRCRPFSPAEGVLQMKPGYIQSFIAFSS